MDGWMDGWMDEWLDGWMDGWTDGWMDGIPCQQPFQMRGLLLVRYSALS